MKYKIYQKNDAYVLLNNSEMFVVYPYGVMEDNSRWLTPIEIEVILEELCDGLKNNEYRGKEIEFVKHIVERLLLFLDRNPEPGECRTRLNNSRVMNPEDDNTPPFSLNYDEKSIECIRCQLNVFVGMKQYTQRHEDLLNGLGFEVRRNKHVVARHKQTGRIVVIPTTPHTRGNSSHRLVKEIMYAMGIE